MTKGGILKPNYPTVKEDGSIDINLQDQVSPSVDLFFTQSKVVPTALTNATAINDTSITVDDPTGFTVTPKTYVGIFSGTGSSGSPRFYFAEVLTVNGSVIGLDTPLDFAFDATDPVIATTREMNVDGSSTPKIFQIAGGASLESTLVIDITKIMIHMVDNATMDDTTFGSVSKLVKGLVVRRVDGVVRNLFNVKDNGEIAVVAFNDVSYPEKVPSGTYVFRASISYAGQGKRGVAIRIAPGESLEAIVQDKVDTIDLFRMSVAAHEVIDP